MTVDDQQRPRRHLAAGALVALAIQVTAVATAAPTSIVIARVVGPSGTGVYGLAVSLFGIAVVVCGLGLAAGISYFVSQRTWPPEDAWREAERAGAALGLVGAAGIVLAQATLGGTLLEGVTMPMALLMAAALPFGMAWTFSSVVALALERYELYGAARVVQPAVALAAVFILVWPLGTLGAVMGMAVSYPAAWAVLHHRMRRALPRAQRSRERVLGQALGFGARAWGADLLQLVNYRLDLFLLNLFVSHATVGRYSVAVSITALAWILPSALQTVLFPRTASAPQADEDPDATVVTALRHSVVLVTVSALVLIPALVAIPLIYGDAFSSSVSYGLLLLPGVTAIGFAKTLSAVITGRGFPQYSLYNSIITMPWTLLLYLTLVPALDGTGAALASTISYITSTVIAAVFFRRATGLSVATSFSSPRAVVRDYRLAAANLFRYVAAARQSP